MRAKLLVAVVLAGAIVLAACGGGGGATSTSTTHSGPTKAEYIAATTGICKSTKARLTPLITKLAGDAPEILTGGAAAVAKAVPAVEHLYSVAASGLSRLRALSQPAGDHAAITRFLTPLSAIVDSIGTVSSGLKKGQGAQALAQLQSDQTLATQVTSAAKKYGLRECETIFSALG
jgi:hypothetical protein